MTEHTDHAAARQKLPDFRAAGDRFALTAQVLAEFVHVVTAPLDMAAALERARIWWESPEIDQLGTDAFSVGIFFTWIRQHRLGRKRILDTPLAANFHEAGIQSVLTTNSRDFTVLGSFVCLTPQCAVQLQAGHTAEERRPQRIPFKAHLCGFLDSCGVASVWMDAAGRGPGRGRWGRDRGGG